ncbi:MAG: outer membrane beta-barrel protein [Gemmatimonadota bacterium]
MSKLFRRLSIVLGAVALLTTAAPEARAQSRWTIEGQGGIAVPTGDLADLEDVGAGFGIGIAYWVHPRIAIRVDGDADILSGVDAEGALPEAPDLNIFHYTAGVSVRLLDPEATRWTLNLNAGAGGSTIDADDFTVSGTTVDFSETYFALNGGLTIGYDVGPNVNVFVGGEAFVVFSDEDDTVVFSQLRSDVEPFDTAVTIPITAGIRVRL